MKIAITGKGGVGKTTISALLAQEFERRGFKVYAIDCDPDANLASVLGVPDPDSIRPIVELKELIKERVGATSADLGAYFTMNPRVDDIPAQYGVRLGNIRLLVMGHLPKARGGCACPENILVRELISHALTLQDEVVILDLEAGIEHLGRGTAQGVDVMLIVVEPSRQSIETAKRIQKLARDLGIKKVLAVGNKVENQNDIRTIEEALQNLPLVAGLSLDPVLRSNSLRGHAVFLTDKVKESFTQMMKRITDE
ncbi:MAG: AAA family ATPase [bacterium]